MNKIKNFYLFLLYHTTDLMKQYDSIEPNDDLDINEAKKIWYKREEALKIYETFIKIFKDDI